MTLFAFIVLMTVNLVVTNTDDGTAINIDFNGIEIIANIPDDGLSCNNLSSCQNGASCSGPGKMLGPCSFKCDSGPEIDCGSN